MSRQDVFVNVENFLSTSPDGSIRHKMFLEMLIEPLLSFLETKANTLNRDQQQEILCFEDGKKVMEHCGIRLSGQHLQTKGENVLAFLEAIKKFTQGTFDIPKLEFELPERYKVIDVIGEGAYGRVLSAYDTERKCNVAVKRICNVFSNKSAYQKRILREIKVMKHLRGFDGVVTLHDLIMPTSFEEFQDVFIVMDLMKGDLKMLRSQRLDQENVMYLMYHICIGIFKMHSGNIVHRDLKPTNILINENLDVRLCDFGLSRGIDDNDPQTSLYVVSRWYRAPEVVLEWPKCSKPMDIWSIGCIFGELLQEERWMPLFPGKSPLAQINSIIDQLGTPKEEDIMGCDKAVRYVKQITELKIKKDWSRKLKYASVEALDLLDHLLQFNPNKRYTIDQVVKHSYFERVYDQDDFTDNPKPFEHQFEQTSFDSYKGMIYEEIKAFKEEMVAKDV
jgi:serine/threonine protein kinase